jgi:hypothetical protein
MTAMFFFCQKGENGSEGRKKIGKMLSTALAAEDNY